MDASKPDKDSRSENRDVTSHENVVLAEIEYMQARVAELETIRTTLNDELAKENPAHIETGFVRTQPLAALEPHDQTGAAADPYRQSVNALAAQHENLRRAIDATSTEIEELERLVMRKWEVSAPRSERRAHRRERFRVARKDELMVAEFRKRSKIFHALLTPLLFVLAPVLVLANAPSSHEKGFEGVAVTLFALMALFTSLPLYEKRRPNWHDALRFVLLAGYSAGLLRFILGL